MRNYKAKICLTGKKSFTKAEARMVIRRELEKRGVLMASYFCHSCGTRHLTSHGPVGPLAKKLLSRFLPK
jgi:hypothetical protein